MITISDSRLIEVELRKRGQWDRFADETHQNHTLFYERDIFYRQQGYFQPDMNFVVWLRFDDQEGEAYQHAAETLLRRALGEQVCQPTARDGQHRASSEGLIENT